MGSTVFVKLDVMLSLVTSKWFIAAEVAKIFLSYDGPKAVMEAAKQPATTMVCCCCCCCCCCLFAVVVVDVDVVVVVRVGVVSVVVVAALVVPIGVHDVVC